MSSGFRGKPWHEETERHKAQNGRQRRTSRSAAGRVPPGRGITASLLAAASSTSRIPPIADSSVPFSAGTCPQGLSGDHNRLSPLRMLRLMAPSVTRCPHSTNHWDTVFPQNPRKVDNARENGCTVALGAATPLTWSFLPPPGGVGGSILFRPPQCLSQCPPSVRVLLFCTHEQPRLDVIVHLVFFASPREEHRPSRHALLARSTVHSWVRIRADGCGQPGVASRAPVEVVGRYGGARCMATSTLWSSKLHGKQLRASPGFDNHRRELSAQP